MDHIDQYCLISNPGLAMRTDPACAFGSRSCAMIKSAARQAMLRRDRRYFRQASLVRLVGALALSGPKARFDMASTITVALTTLLECAKRATVALGGIGARFDASIVRTTQEGFLPGGNEDALNTA